MNCTQYYRNKVEEYMSIAKIHNLTYYILKYNAYFKISEHNTADDSNIPQVNHDNPSQIFCQHETHSGEHIL